MIRNGPQRLGFTIVELITTIVIIAVVMGVASGIISAGLRSYTSAAGTTELQTRMSAAMERIIVELRQARVRAGSSPVAAEITTAQASTIAWTMPDGTTRQLALSGTDLRLTVNGTVSTLLDNVSSLVITYRDQSGALIAAPITGATLDTIHTVRVQFTASRDGVTETLRTQVFLRARVVATTSS